MSENQEILTEARFHRVKARIRGGRVQRQKVVSNLKGYSYRGGHLERMSSTERRHRHLGQIRGARRRIAHMNQAVRRRALSMRRRQSYAIR